MTGTGKPPEHVSVMPKISMAGDFVVKAGWTLGPRTIDEYELVYFPNGTQALYKVNDQVYLLDKPCFVFTRPGEQHSYIFDAFQPTRHLFVHFSLDENSHTYDALPSILTPHGASFIAAPETSPAAQMLKHILYLANKSDHDSELRCSSLLHAVLWEVAGLSDESVRLGTDASVPLQISKAIQYIDNHLDRNITIHDIAAYVGWRHEHFTRLFVRHMGVSPRRFIIYRRIERACLYLIQQELSIKEIAYAVGFQDEHYFSRVFAKVKGLSATEYRNRYADPRFRHLHPAEEYQTAYPLNRYISFGNA
jgi:AraC family transcriptional regulator